MNWQPAYALLLFASTGVTYLAAIGIDRYDSKRLKKVFLVSSLILNLSILFLFKYYNFFTSNIQDLLHYYGLAINIPEFKFLLPVGISFYIFQALGYSIDVYRGTTKVEKNFFTYALFVSFFPQLVAGPIERSNNLLPQFKEKHHFDYEQTMLGIRMMLWGYFLKLVLADRCGLYVDMVYNNVGQHNGGSYLLATVIFPFQIYGDFAGYSLIAIGAARILGFQLMTNFRRPYFASSVGEFWRRWHISLSTWFKDYLYIPLGGNRVSRPRQYFNLLITFIISGIWHGANWTYILWGTTHGLFLCLEKFLGIGKKSYSGFNRLLHWIPAHIMICSTWILFRANNISDVKTIVINIFTNFNYPKPEFANFIAIFIAVVILLCKEVTEEFEFKFTLSKSSSWLVCHLYIVFMIAYIILFGVLGGDQFIYFQF